MMPLAFEPQSQNVVKAQTRRCRVAWSLEEALSRILQTDVVHPGSGRRKLTCPHRRPPMSGRNLSEPSYGVFRYAVERRAVLNGIRRSADGHFGTGCSASTLQRRALRLKAHRRRAIPARLSACPAGRTGRNRGIHPAPAVDGQVRWRPRFSQPDWPLLRITWALTVSWVWKAFATMPAYGAGGHLEPAARRTRMKVPPTQTNMTR